MRFLELYGNENDCNELDSAEYSSGGIMIKQVVDMEGMPVTVHNLDFPSQRIIHDVYDSGKKISSIRGRHVRKA